MQIQVIARNGFVPATGLNSVYLGIDNWNDFSYVTLFHVSLHDENGDFHDIGSVKIGFKGQTIDTPTHETITQVIAELPISYFSLGTDLDYYKKIKSQLSNIFADEFLAAMRDIVFDKKNWDMAGDEAVLGTSLMRGVSLSVINGQFKKILSGGSPLTDFHFIYRRVEEEDFAGIDLNFRVAANAKPNTNIHAIIGRNGVGKTTLLNGMIDAITANENEKEMFLQPTLFTPTPISSDYFSSLVSVSFSAFDPFTPPQEQTNPALGTCYYYIGLKDPSDENGYKLKTLPELWEEFISNLSQCWSEPGKKERWLSILAILQSDENFAEMNLSILATFSSETLSMPARHFMKKMSSGHAIVLLTLTKLVATVEEKTLVLIDEPESHLHPPLLSAFIRALSQLLYERNGVAIIATHSPVVLQEIPKSCVRKIIRSRLAISVTIPEIETFGENVGILTREIFGLEVVKSGFHTLLANDVINGNSYEYIVNEYGDQLGLEARAILRSMVLQRDKPVAEE